ncbi:dGTP triphosphohydrolase [Roseivirga sp. BDSF3-8]|uniref:dGTP triphosphohydrolase n=1 Tax=Roseivirga sp. BDSF3-8 TaxID=3241598 RepID=UPI0035321BB1
MNWLQLLTGDEKQNGESFGTGRSAFERDYDRIVFSHPFRRLQDKTQVFPLPEHSFVHTRLTHSIEVSSVARSLGKEVGEKILQKEHELTNKGINLYDFGAITGAAALAHDIGNPPFGHSGEDAISDFFRHHPKVSDLSGLYSTAQWEDLCNFEGNAQGFRLLNQKGYQGLKLKAPTLAAFTKYPRESLMNEQDKKRRSQKKYGFFQSEKEIFADIARSLGLRKLGGEEEMAWCRHPLAFLVEAADDICYNVIDLEDGCRLGFVSFEEARDLLADLLGDSYDASKLERYRSVSEKIGTLRALAIGRLIGQCTDLFIEKEGDILSGAYDTSLTDDIPASNTLGRISAISVEKIYRAQPVKEREMAGFEVLGGLLSAFIPAAFSTAGLKDLFGNSKKHTVAARLLPEEVHYAIKEADKDAYRITLAIVDYVSGMTDRHAVSVYRRLMGISLPVV